MWDIYTHPYLWSRRFEKTGSVIKETSFFIAEPSRAFNTLKYTMTPREDQANSLDHRALLTCLGLGFHETHIRRCYFRKQPPAKAILQSSRPGLKQKRISEVSRWEGAVNEQGERVNMYVNKQKSSTPQDQKVPEDSLRLPSAASRARSV